MATSINELELKVQAAEEKFSQRASDLAEAQANLASAQTSLKLAQQNETEARKQLDEANKALAAAKAAQAQLKEDIEKASERPAPVISAEAAIESFESSQQRYSITAEEIFAGKPIPPAQPAPQSIEAAPVVETPKKSQTTVSAAEIFAAAEKAPAPQAQPQAVEQAPAPAPVVAAEANDEAAEEEAEEGEDDDESESKTSLLDVGRNYYNDPDEME